MPFHKFFVTTNFCSFTTLPQSNGLNFSIHILEFYKVSLCVFSYQPSLGWFHSSCITIPIVSWYNELWFDSIYTRFNKFWKNQTYLGVLIWLLHSTCSNQLLPNMKLLPNPLTATSFLFHQIISHYRNLNFSSLVAISSIIYLCFPPIQSVSLYLNIANVKFKK